MLLIKQAALLRDVLAFYHKKNNNTNSVGFVPTMGALHEGHLSLVARAKAENQYVVCSIFVNPTQFNNANDLEKYPRTAESDIRMLQKAGADLLFMPTVREVYPTDAPPTLAFDFGKLDKVMEGEFRPGHFAGVAQVVSRLLDLVAPQRLYMGQKDYQQFSIVAEMLRQLALPVELVVCPIAREANGLAMSSRNVRLSPDMRARAGIIYATLNKAKQMMLTHSPTDIEKQMLQDLATEKGIIPEYFKIVDGDSLQPINCFDEARSVVACVAVVAENVRLIDNEILK